MNTPFSDLRDQILREAALRPSPTRADAQRRRVVTYALAAAISVAGTLLGANPSIGELQPWLVASLASVGVSSWWLVSRAASPLGHSRTALSISSCSVPVLLMIGAVVSGPVTAAEPRLDTDVPCMIMSLVLALLLFALLAYGLRPMNPAAPGITGMAMGSAVGSWVTLIFAVRCPLGGLTHLTVAHIIPALGISIGAALFGQRHFSVRRIRLAEARGGRTHP